MSRPALAAARAEDVWGLLRAAEWRPTQRLTPTPAAMGQTMAADVRSRTDFPPFDRAVMDGYAVRTADFGAGAARLRVAGLARAGGADAFALASGACVQINTGAPMPSGADAIVIVENSTADGDFVILNDHPKLGQHIEPRASLAQAGGLLIRAGTRLGCGAVAALVAAGVREVEAFARPRVTLLSTGDEVAPAEAELTPGQIYDSNTVALAPLIERGGAELVRRERCPDDPAPLRAQLELGLGGDLLCVVGGMSKGTHDLVPQLLEELGVEWLVTSLNLKPGKPTRIGRRGGAWVIGLPGNPVSAAICFLLFGTRILAGLQGRAVGPPLRLRGEVQVDMPANGARPLFQPAQWSTDREGAPRVCPIAWRGSGDPFGLASADALLYRPAGAPPLTCGEHTPFIPLEIPE